jgi:hypothetical protein
MGGAFTSLADDAQAVYTNPAGLGFLEHVEIAGGTRRFFDDIVGHQATWVWPLSPTALNLSDFGTLAAGFQNVDYGELTGRDDVGNLQGGFGAEDRVVSAAYGKRVGPAAAGVTAKFYRFRLDNARAAGVAIDAGMLYRQSSWSTGGAVRNTGGGLRFDKTQENIPMVFLAGVALHPWGSVGTISADLVDPKDDAAGFRAGGELWVARLLALRAGYDSTQEAQRGMTVGMGLRLDQVEIGFFPIRRLTLDYAFAPAGDLDDLHSVSLAFQFGEP